LGTSVLTHRAVIIEMIASEIRQQSDVELDSCDAILCEAVRGDFHAHGTRALAHEVTQPALQPHRVGRRVADRLELARPAAAKSADDPAFTADARERLRNPVAARGLAVGS